MIAVMEHAGIVIGSYAATFGSIAAFTWWMLRRGRTLARQLPDEDKPWI